MIINKFIDHPLPNRSNYMVNIQINKTSQIMIHKHDIRLIYTLTTKLTNHAILRKYWNFPSFRKNPQAHALILDV